MNVVFTFAIMLVLVAINAFYVAAEFAFLGVSAIVAEERAATEVWARRMYEYHTDQVKQDHYIVVAQLGVTLASLALGVYSEHALAKECLDLFAACGWVGETVTASAHFAASVVSLTIITYMHVVLGEMVPKSIAIINPITTARFVDYPMYISGFVFAPFVSVLNFLGNVVLKLLRLPVSEASVLVYSPEELGFAFEESKDEGLLKEERYDWLRHVLDMEERTVGQVMVARIRVAGLSEDTSVREAMKVVSSEKYSRYPVYHGDIDHIVGTVHVRDLFIAMRDGDSETSVGSIKRDCPKFPESLGLDQVLQTMRDEQAHMGAVVDEHGGIAGIVTMEDLVEEVFGEVFDEFDDKEVEPIVPESDDAWLVLGTVLLDDLADLIGCKFDEEIDVDTVSGYVMDLLARLPEKGDVVESCGLSFEVLDVEDMVPARCRVKRLVAPNAEAVAED